MKFGWFLLGCAVGALGFFLYTRRASLGFAVENRGKIDGASQIVEGFKKVFG